MTLTSNGKMIMNGELRRLRKDKIVVYLK